MARIPQSVGGATPQMREQLAQQAQLRAQQAQAQRGQIQGDTLGPLGISGAAQAVPGGPPPPVNQVDSSAGFDEQGVPFNTVPPVEGEANPYQEVPDFQAEAQQFNQQDFEQGNPATDPVDPRQAENLAKQQYYSGQAAQWEKPTLGIDYNSYSGVQKLLNYGTRNTDLETIAGAGSALALGMSSVSATASSPTDINATQSATTGRNSLFAEVKERSNGAVNETALVASSLNAVTKVLYEAMGGKSQDKPKDVLDFTGNPNVPEDEGFGFDSFDSLDLNNKSDAIIPADGIPLADARRRVGSSSKNFLAQEARLNGAGNNVIAPIKGLDSDLLGTALDAAIANGLATVNDVKNPDTDVTTKVVYPSLEGRRLISAQIENASNLAGGPLSARVIVPPKKPSDAVKLPYTLESERSGVKTRRGGKADLDILNDPLVKSAAYNLARTKHSSTPGQLGALAVAVNIATDINMENQSDPELKDAHKFFKNFIGIGDNADKKIDAKRAAKLEEKAGPETIQKIKMQEANKLIRTLSSWSDITSSGTPEYARVSIDPTFGRMYDMNPRTNPANPVNRFLNNYQEPVFLQVPNDAVTRISKNKLGDKLQAYLDKRASSNDRGLNINASTDIQLANIAFTIADFINPANNRDQPIADQVNNLTFSVISDAARVGGKIITLFNKLGVYKDGATGNFDPQAINNLLPTKDDSGNNLARDKEGAYTLDRGQTTSLDFNDPEIKDGVKALHSILKDEKLKDAHPKLLAYLTAAELVAHQSIDKPWRPKAIAGADGNSAGPVFASISAGRPELARNAGLLMVEGANANTNTRSYVSQVMADKLGNEATQRRIFKSKDIGISDFEPLSTALQDAIANASESDLKNALKGPTTVDAYDFPDFLHQGTIRTSKELNEILVDTARPFYTDASGVVNEQGLLDDMANLLSVTLQHSKEQFVAREVKSAQQVAMHFGEYLTPKGPRGIDIPLGSAGLREINNGKSTTVTLPDGEHITVTDKEVAKGVLNQKKAKKVVRWNDKKNEYVNKLHEYAHGSNDVNQSVVINGQRLESEAMMQLSQGINEDSKHVNSWSQVFDYFEGTAMSFPEMFHEMNRAGGAVDRALKWNPVEASQNAVEALPRKLYEKLVAISKSDNPNVDLGRNGDFAYVYASAEQADMRLNGEDKLDPNNPDDKYSYEKNKGLMAVYKTLGIDSLAERQANNPELRWGDIPSSLSVPVTNWLKPVEYHVYVKGRLVKKRKKAFEALLDLYGLGGNRAEDVKASIGRAKRYAAEAKANKRFYT